MSYRPAATLIQLFRDLVTSHTLVTEEVIGQTVRGNDIYAFHFGNSTGEHIMWEGCIHSDEVVNGEILYQYALWLLAGSSAANKILNGFYTTIIPILNIDNYQMSGNASVRKNANGVDLNRNFPAGYDASVAGGCDPATAGCCSQKLRSTVPGCYNYGGVTALDQPESLHVHNYVSSVKPSWFIDMHAFDTTGPIYYNNNSTVRAVIDAYTKAVPSNGYHAYNAGSSYAGGYAFQDADSLGCKSILWEFGRYGKTVNPPFADILPIWFPLFLPMAKLISGISPSENGGGGIGVPLLIIAGITIPLFAYWFMFRR